MKFFLSSYTLQNKTPLAGNSESEKRHRLCLLGTNEHESWLLKKQWYGKWWYGNSWLLFVIFIWILLPKWRKNKSSSFNCRNKFNLFCWRRDGVLCFMLVHELVLAIISGCLATRPIYARPVNYLLLFQCAQKNSRFLIWRHLEVRRNYH